MVACVDRNPEKLSKFMEHWDIPFGFCSFEEAKASGLNFDIVCICTPTEAHYSDLWNAIELEPDLIFCEKPLTSGIESSQKIVGVLEDLGILLAVNYIRRWDSYTRELKRAIDGSIYGRVTSVCCSYNKGILNNGSHMVDLMRFLLGDLELMSVGAASIDYDDRDPTISAMLRSGDDVQVALIGAVPAKNFSIFEASLTFEKGIVCMLDGGLNWSYREVIDSLNFSQYRVLGRHSVREGTLNYSMRNAVDNIWSALKEGGNLKSSGENALQAQQLCCDIYNRLNKQ